MINQLHISIDKVRIVIESIKQQPSLDALLVQMPDNYQVSGVFADSQGVES
ncbi:hypothetical protein SPONN_2073 [uncultured Candidatus Thioglobus sp.]|nr:hypothetical protein SPONN_2073 [uncultured Candidatus Thioglobus sp.]